MPDNIKIHSVIPDDLSDIIKKIAQDKNLGCIDYEKNYRLYKVGSKKNDVTIQLIEKTCVGSGEVRIVGTEDVACLFISSLREWFRTSEIVSCKKKKTFISIETRNSMYELVEDE
jgi:hypothetical protein